MHFSFWEKTGFALLMAAWVTWGSNQIGDILVHAEELSENAYKIEVADSGGGSGGAADKEPEKSAIELLASATSERGEKVFKKCAACHSIEKGGPDKVGPHLWNVLGREKGSVAGFAYSDTLAGMNTPWDYETMDKFLESPRNFVSGTKMTFAGLRKASDRAAVILYLRDHNDNPPPLP